MVLTFNSLSYNYILIHVHNPSRNDGLALFLIFPLFLQFNGTRLRTFFWRGHVPRYFCQPNHLELICVQPVNNRLIIRKVGKRLYQTQIHFRAAISLLIT